jgi:hypothetical protein
VGYIRVFQFEVMRLFVSFPPEISCPAIDSAVGWLEVRLRVLACSRPQSASQQWLATSSRRHSLHLCQRIPMLAIEGHSPL